MNGQGGSSRVVDLVKLLRQMELLYGRLLELVHAKVSAMRRADVHAMRELNEEEAAVAHRIAERDGLRRQLMDVIGRELGLADGEGRSLAISAFAARLSEAGRSELMAAADALKDVVTKTAWANRAAQIATRDVLQHLQWITASIRPQTERSGDYSPAGAKVPLADTLLFDVLG